MKKALAVVLLATVLTLNASAIQPIGPLDMERVRQIAEMLPESTSGIGPNYKDRELWDRLYQSGQYGAALGKAEEMLSKGFPKWDQEAYDKTFSEGDTNPGKYMMENRSRAFSTLVWAECLENKGRFTPLIISFLYDIMGQETWVSSRMYKKRNCGGLVELCTALMSHLLSQALFMLDDKVPDSVREDLLGQLYTRAFDPLMGAIEGKNKDHGWLQRTNNWNPVCLEGVVCAAMEMIPDRLERAKYVAIAEKYIQNYMEGFQDDGYCTEGISYYNFGMAHFIVLREKLYRDTQGKIDLFRNNPKVRSIATFPQNIVIVNEVYPSIADCNMAAKPKPSILRYLGRELGLPLPFSKTPSLGNTDNVTTVYLDVYQNYAAEMDDSGDAGNPLRSYFEQSGILVVRDPKNRFGAALKGGHNAESHNHNDIGSYTIVSGKEKMVEDPGLIPYNIKSFTPERYTAFKSLGSYGHNVPFICGKTQSAGKNFMATNLSCSFSDRRDLFGMELSSAYEIPQLKESAREFDFDRKKLTLTVTDRFRFDSAQVFETAVTTRADVQIIDRKKIELSRNGESMTLTIHSSSNNYEIIIEEITEGRTPYTRIAVRLRPETAGTVTLKYKVR